MEPTVLTTRLSGGEGRRQNGRTDRAEPVGQGEGHYRPALPLIGCGPPRGNAGPARVKVTFGRDTQWSRGGAGWGRSWFRRGGDSRIWGTLWVCSSGSVFVLLREFVRTSRELPLNPNGTELEAKSENGTRHECTPLMARQEQFECR